jgi:hypothetical protein
MPQALIKWDTASISTPGLLRTHQQELGIPLDIIQEWEEYIDIAEIVDGALYATPDAAHDFSIPAVRLQTLFSTTHPFINKELLFKNLVKDIMASASPEKLLDKDPLYTGILEYEREKHVQRFQFYTKHTKQMENVAISNFMQHNHFPGLSRFLPYALFPDVEYAIQILPESHGVSSISCGINPWKKPNCDDKHLGNFFAEHFSGGGHSFVAGGKIAGEDVHLIDTLITFLQNS